MNDISEQSKFGARLSGSGGLSAFVFNLRKSNDSRLCVMTAKVPPNFLDVSIEYIVGFELSVL